MDRSPDQYTMLSARIKILNAQMAFMHERIEEQKENSVKTNNMILSDLKSIKTLVEKLSEEQRRQWDRIGEMRLLVEEQKHIHPDNCIQQGTLSMLDSKIGKLYIWKDELSKDLLEYNFVKKYPKLLYLLVFVAVVLALVAIYKLSKV